MSKILLTLTVFIAIMLGITSVYAHHTLAHRELVLNEQSAVAISLLVCDKKEDADSVLIAYEKGGHESARTQYFSLLNLNKDDGSACLRISDFVTPLVVYRRISIEVPRGGEIVQGEASLIQIQVGKGSASKTYFSPATIPVRESGADA